jgi:LPXTG-motif cell wall-anchored protein
MLRKTLLSTYLFTVLMCGATGVAIAQNDSPYKDAYFTFSQPVTLPNLTLPPGKYLFRVTGEGRSIVQIYAGDRSKLLGTVMSVHAARSDQPEKAEIRLIESSANAPVAVGTWWYPGQRQGWEFVYPRSQAVTLAKDAKQPILTTAKDVSGEDMKSAELVRLSASGEQPYSGSKAAPVTIAGTAQVGDVAAADQNANRVAAAMSGQASAQTPASQARTPAPAPAATQSARAEPARTTLPQTASRTPFIVLMGLVALAAAAALRHYRRSAV